MTKRISVEQMPEVENDEQMRHLVRYVNFINSRPERDLKRDGKFFNIHHIIPRSLNGADEESNLIKLTHREHFVAHMILWKSYSSEMTYAFWMISSKFKINSKMYESIKMDLRNTVSSNMKNRVVVNNGFTTLRCKPDLIPYGYEFGHTYRVRDELKKQYKEFFSNSIWITDGKTNRRIPSTEKIPIDFYLGKTEVKTTLDRGKSTRSSIWINNGFENKRFFGSDIPFGWNFGMIKKAKIKETKKKWINNGVNNRKINKNDIVPQGWKKGLLTVRG